MSNKRITKSAQSKKGQYDLQQDFAGYNARLDKTLLPANTLIAPSQNVVIGTSKRIALVKGYELDGATSAVIDSGILSNYDFDNFKNDRRNLRAGFLTVAGNDGKLQYRYDNGTTITWKDLLTSLTSINFCFTTFTDITEKIKLCLFVNGTGDVFEWNGAVTTLASATANTVTKQGTGTWASEGFYTAKASRSITINGVTATYSGGEGTTTLTGVSVDFSNVGTYPVASVIHQTPVTTAISAMTSIETTFKPTVVGTGKDNQLYIGMSTSNNQYISKVNNYTDFTFNVPTRVAGEGMLLRLPSPPVKYIAQEVQNNADSYDMYISSGKNSWQIVRSTLSSDNTQEKIELINVKVAPQQGAKSERLVTKMKNHVVFIGDDNVANFFGYISYQYVPVMVDFSYPIIDDMNSYDYTNASMFYHKNYIYIAIPSHGLIRVYNMTDQSKQQTQYSVEQVDQQPFFWEAPIGYPISGFYVVDGELYGHSYTTSESYKLFTGGSFNGQDIDANATFAFNDKGDRTQTKASDEVYTEGYIKQNTDLNVTISGDLDACQNSQTKVINGADRVIVCYGGGGGSLGSNPLGTRPLGLTLTNTSPLPAWFHSVKTYPQVPFYLEQISFNTKGVDLQWELITFGTNSKETTEGNNSITQ